MWYFIFLKLENQKLLVVKPDNDGIVDKLSMVSAIKPQQFFFLTERVS